MNRAIADYALAKGSTDYSLTKAVLELVRKGWEPLGGVTYTERMGEYVQAMVLYQK